MEDLSLHILDIVENSIRAKAKKVEIKILEDKEKDLLILEIKDDGEGMTEEVQKKALDPFFSTKNKRIGLGLPLLAQSAKEAEGSLEVKSKEGKGTSIKATFKLSHIDRKPLGKIDETIKCLTIAHPEVNFCFIRRNHGHFNN
jgi:signal transduction histidine kinase